MSGTITLTTDGYQDNNLYLSIESGAIGLAGQTVAIVEGLYPLQVIDRYVAFADGTPVLLHGDTPWALEVQLTNAEITTYLEDRAEKGFRVVMFEAIEHFFSSQSPEYRNVSGEDPFTSMTNFASPNEDYWLRVDHIVDEAKRLGIICVINPAYLGYPSTEEGWDTEVSAESDADLQTYGAFLANRYDQGNVIWCLGGDATPNNTLRDKQWQIVTGIRSVRTTDLITAHAFPGDPAYPTWNGKTGFNLNSAYPSTSDTTYAECDTEYARGMAFFMLEHIYEQERGSPISAAGLRRQSYQALLSGACGQFFGNSPIWHFESPNAPYSYTGTWESNLDSTGSTQQQYVGALFEAFEWWKLEPKTDTSLVSSSLSSGDTRVCAALASDDSFAMVWVPSSQTVTVVMSALAPSSVRVRLYNTTDGSYSLVGTYANTGSQGIATGGERVIVLDAATPLSVSIDAGAMGIAGQTVAVGVDGSNFVYAASASLSDVQDAVDDASDGDTVLIPNGSATWTGGISTSKQIIIRAENYTPTPAGTEGAGTSSRNVTITNNSDDPLFSLTSGNDYHCGLGGIRFNDGSGDGSHFTLSGSGTKVPLIFDLYIENRNRFWPAQQCIVVNCLGGVMWNCYMQGTGDMNSVGEGSFLIKAGSMPAWTSASTMGDLDTNGDKNFYVEDSTFKNVGNCPDIEDQGRFVCRHFDYDGTWGETHGFTSISGGRHWEYYDGIFQVTTSIRNMAGRYFWCRAGTGLFTDNEVNQHTNPSEHGGVSLLNIGDNTSPSGSYLIPRQPGCGHNGSGYVSDPIYIWDQTGSRAYTWGFQGSPGDWSTVVEEDRDIFVDNGAKSGYTKYTYPHPFREVVE